MTIFANNSRNATIARIWQNLTSLGVNTIVSALTPLLMTPLFLTFWGPTRYGGWLLLSSAAALLSLADIGVQGYVGNRMCIAFNRQEHSTIRAWFARGLVIQLTAAIVISMGMGLWWLCASGSSGGPFQEKGGQFAVGLLLGDGILSVVLGLIPAAIRASGNLHKAARFSTIQRLCQTLSIALAVYLSHSYVILAGVKLGITLLSIWPVIRLAKAYVPTLFDPFRSELKESYWTTTRHSLSFWAIPLSDFLAQQSVLWILQKQFGLHWIAMYVTHKTMMNYPVTLGSLVTSSVSVELTSMYAIGDWKRLARGFGLYLSAHAAVVSLGALFMYLAGGELYSLWTSNQLAIDRPLAYWLCLRTIMWSAWNPIVNLFLSIEQQHFALVAMVVGSGLGVVLCAYAGPESKISIIPKCFLFAEVASVAIVVFASLIGRSEKIRQLIIQQPYVQSTSQFGKF